MGERLVVAFSGCSGITAILGSNPTVMIEVM